MGKYKKVINDGTKWQTEGKREITHKILTKGKLKKR